MVPIDYHGALDLALFRLLNQGGGPALDALMRGLSSKAFGLGAACVLALVLLARLGRAAAAPLLALGLAVVASDLVPTLLVRPALHRMRPCYALPPGTFRWLAPAANGPSLPSLHASNAFALALVAARALPALAAPVYLLAAGVALSRVYVGVHWPSDIVAGAAWGTLAGLAAWRLARVGSGAAAAARAPRPPPGDV